MRPKKSPKSELPRLTARRFADLLGVSPGTISGWLHAGMPAERSGRQGREVSIDLTLALPWVIAHRHEAPGSERERLAGEQADKVALANARERGRLIYADQVADVLNALAADLVSRLDSLPGRCAGELAGLCDPAVIRARLLDECRIVRGAFASAAEKLADALGSA